MGGLSPVHLIIVLVVALLVLGPGKLPEVGAALGRSIRELRSALEGTDEAPASPVPGSGQHPPEPPSA